MSGERARDPTACSAGSWPARSRRRSSTTTTWSSPSATSPRGRRPTSCSCPGCTSASAAELTEADGPLLGRLFAAAAGLRARTGIAERLPARDQRRALGRPDRRPPPRPPARGPVDDVAARMRPARSDPGSASAAPAGRSPCCAAALLAGCREAATTVPIPSVGPSPTASGRRPSRRPRTRSPALHGRPDCCRVAGARTGPAESPTLADGPAARPQGAPARRRPPRGSSWSTTSRHAAPAYAGGSEMAGLPRQRAGAGPVPERRPARDPPGRLHARLLHLVAGDSPRTRGRRSGRPWPRWGRDPDRPLGRLGDRAGGRVTRRRRRGIPASLTGSGCSTTAQARIRSRFTLRVWVRGKSASGHSRQATTRWFMARVALARLTAASISARSSAGRDGGPRRPGPGRRRRGAGPRSRARGRPPRSGRAGSR